MSGGAQYQPAQIPDGGWQRALGVVLFAIGVFADLAATPFNGAGSVAAAAFGLAGPLFFWGILLRYISIIERKVDRLAERGAGAGVVHDVAIPPGYVPPSQPPSPTQAPPRRELTAEEREELWAKRAADARAADRLTIIILAGGVGLAIIALVIAYATGSLSSDAIHNGSGVTQIEQNADEMAANMEAEANRIDATP